MASSFWGAPGRGLTIRAPTSQPAGHVPETPAQTPVWLRGCGLPGAPGLEGERRDTQCDVRALAPHGGGPGVGEAGDTVGEPLRSCCSLCGCPTREPHEGGVTSVIVGSLLLARHPAGRHSGNARYPVGAR